VLGIHWDLGSFLAKSSSFNIHEMPHQSAVCYGDYYNYELVYLEGIECEWLFNNEDPSVQHCNFSFKAKFALVIHRAKSQRASPMLQWLDNLP
jgi:hypothetical protein